MSTLTQAGNAETPDDESDYDADFTTEQAKAMVTCRRCSEAFPSGSLRVMHSKISGGSDRFFCSKCFDYYRSKKTTIRRTPRTQDQGPSTSNKGSLIL